MTLRTVTSHIANLHGAARAGDPVRFRLLDGMYTATEHVPADVQTVTIDSGGDISTVLYCPATYDVIIANAMRFQIVVPDSAAATTLEVLHATVTDPPAGVTALQAILDSVVLRGNNLNDLTNAATARANLSVPSAAEMAAELATRAAADTTLTAAQTAAAAAIPHTGTLTLAQALLYASGNVVTIEAYGAVANSAGAASANVTAINAAIAAAIAGNKRVGTLNGGLYYINGTINVQNCAGLTIEGGSGGPTSTTGTILQWVGNTTAPAVLVEDTRDLIMRHVLIRTEATHPLAVGIRSTNGPTVNPITNNTYDHVIIDGGSGYLGCGWQFSLGAGGDANNDESLFFNCIVTNFGTGGGLYTNPCGVSFEHAQSKGHQFIRCNINGGGLGKYGVSTALGASNQGGSFTWHGGVISNVTEACFYLGAPNDVTHIASLQSESSGRFLLTTGPSSNTWPVSIDSVRFDAVTSYAADLKLIDYRAQGPLSIRNSTFNASDGQAFTINLNNAGLTDCTLTIEDCTVQSTLAVPWVYPTTAGTRVRIMHNYRSQSGALTAFADILTTAIQRRVYVPATAFSPGIGAPALATVGAAAAQSRVFALLDAVRGDVFTTYQMPADYSGGAFTIKLLWTIATTPSVGDLVYLGVQIASLSPGDAIDVTKDTDSGFTTYAVPATAMTLVSTTMLTNGAAVAGDILRIEVKRHGETPASDTYAGTMYLLGVSIEYPANVVA